MAAQLRDMRLLHIVGLCLEHTTNPLKFLHNCAWSSFLLQGVLEDNVEKHSKSVKGLNSENEAMLTNSKLLLYNCMIV